MFYQNYAYIFAVTTIVFNSKNHSYGKEKCKGLLMKTQVTENDQLSDIVFILDKMELLLQAISEIDKNGRYKTVPADKEHRKLLSENRLLCQHVREFSENFWSQFKDLTRFGLLTIKEDTLDSPEVRQAVEDIAAGNRKSDAVDEFLKKYEIVPRTKENQSINNQNQEEMAKKNQTQQQAAPKKLGQQPKYRYNESMINWEELKHFGLSREELQERGLLDPDAQGIQDQPGRTHDQLRFRCFAHGCTTVIPAVRGRSHRIGHPRYPSETRT